MIVALGRPFCGDRHRALMQNIRTAFRIHVETSERRVTANTIAKVSHPAEAQSKSGDGERVERGHPLDNPNCYTQETSNEIWNESRSDRGKNESSLKVESLFELRAKMALALINNALLYIASGLLVLYCVWLATYRLLFHPVSRLLQSVNHKANASQTSLPSFQDLGWQPSQDGTSSTTISFTGEGSYGRYKSFMTNMVCEHS